MTLLHGSADRARHDTDMRYALESVLAALKAVETPTRIHTVIRCALTRFLRSQRNLDIEDLYSFRWDLRAILKKQRRIAEEHQNPYIVEEFQRQYTEGLEAIKVLHDALQNVKAQDPFYRGALYTRMRSLIDISTFRDEAYNWLEDPDAI